MAASRSPSMRLPVEVLEAVIDKASDNSSTLRHLSLTCTTLLPRSRLHLFRKIIIRTEDKLWSSCEFFDSHPWLVYLVQKVTLRPCEPKAHQINHIGLLGASPVHLLNRLPNLHMWKLQDSDILDALSLHSFTLRSYQKYGDHIRCLQLHNIWFFNFSDFKGLVSAFSRIDSLKCSKIGFKSMEREHAGSSPVTVGMNAQLLPISTLQITDLDSDCRANEYLLARSGSKLKNLTLELLATVTKLDSDFERLEKSMMWLTSLSSLVFVLYYPDSDYGPSDDDMSFSRTILSATKILQQVNRRCLKDVRVEFKADPIAKLGHHLSRDSTLCKDLEAALLTFPKAPVLVRDPVHWRRAGRGKLWSPIICRAFPNLDQRGLLSLEFTASKAFFPDAVGHESWVASLVVSQNNVQAVTASPDGTIIVWDMASGTVLQEWLAHDEGSSFQIALSPDGRRLVSSGQNTLVVWDIDGSNSVQKVAELEGHTDLITACAWSPDGSLIASGSVDGTVRIWDGQTYHHNDLLRPYADYVHDGHSALANFKLGFSPNGRYLAWMSGGNCCLWTCLAEDPPKSLRSHPDRPDVLATAFSFDHGSRYIATAHHTYYPRQDPDPDAYVVRIWDTATGAPLAILTGYAKGLSNMSFSSDGRSLLSVSLDMAVRVWDCGTWSGKLIGVSVDSQACYSFTDARPCFRHDGKYMVAALDDGAVQLWRRDDGSYHCVATFREHYYLVTRMAFSPNGQFLVSGDHRGVVHIRCISKYIDE